MLSPLWMIKMYQNSLRLTLLKSNSWCILSRTCQRNYQLNVDQQRNKGTIGCDNMRENEQKVLSYWIESPTSMLLWGCEKQKLVKRLWKEKDWQRDMRWLKKVSAKIRIPSRIIRFEASSRNTRTSDPYMIIRIEVSSRITRIRDPSKITRIIDPFIITGISDPCEIQEISSQIITVRDPSKITKIRDFSQITVKS